VGCDDSGRRAARDLGAQRFRNLLDERHRGTQYARFGIVLARGRLESSD
jgi:hypothetical protein